MQVDKHMMTIAQLVEQTDDFAVIRVAKHDKASFTIEEGDTFFTLMFVRHSDDKDGSLQPYHPFWHEDPAHFVEGEDDG